MGRRRRTTAGGASVAYVFVHVLPEIAAAQRVAGYAALLLAV